MKKVGYILRASLLVGTLASILVGALVSDAKNLEAQDESIMLYTCVDSGDTCTVVHPHGTHERRKDG